MQLDMMESLCAVDFYRSGAFCLACGSPWLIMSLIFVAVAVILVGFWKLLQDSNFQKFSTKILLEQGGKMIVSSIQIIATFSRLQTNLTSELISFFNALDIGNLNISVLGYECGGMLQQYWGLWKLKILSSFFIFVMFLLAFLFSLVFEVIKKRGRNDLKLWVFRQFHTLSRWVSYTVLFFPQVFLLFSIVIAIIWIPLVLRIALVFSPILSSKLFLVRADINTEESAVYLTSRVSISQVFSFHETIPFNNNLDWISSASAVLSTL